MPSAVSPHCCSSSSPVTLFHSSFLSTKQPKLSCPSSLSAFSIHRRLPTTSKPTSFPAINAVELDQNTLVAMSVGVASVAIGIGIPIFYETQNDSAAKRDNNQPCFPCSGTGARKFPIQQCRFCTGTGNVSVVLGGSENEVSQCVNCDGAGSLTCTTCQGTGIQPRYLDRREFKDDD